MAFYFYAKLLSFIILSMFFYLFIETLCKAILVLLRTVVVTGHRLSFLRSTLRSGDWYIESLEKCTWDQPCLR